MLAGINRANGVDEKISAIEGAVQLATTLDAMRRDAAISAIKAAAKGLVKPSSIDEMARPNKRTENGAGEDERPQFRLSEKGDLWSGYGEGAIKITDGGAACITEMVTVDDGGEAKVELTLEVRIPGRAPLSRRVPSEDSGDSKAMVKHIKGMAGPLLSVVQPRLLTTAIDAISRGQMVEAHEVARTGWIDTPGGLVYATPGGSVGALPDGWRTWTDPDYARFGIADGTDDEFQQGLDGLLNGFIREAFEPNITYPALAFALLPPAARFLGLTQKVWMHFSGETGSMKTTTARYLHALYGSKFASSTPFLSFVATPNMIERVLWVVADGLAVVDDYKPRLLKTRDFVDLVHRYADGNERGRLASNSEILRRKPPRAWILSTGEDVPTGESSLMARMLVLRFPRRPQGSPGNNGLRKMQRLSKHFPVVMARWIAWLRDAEFDWAAEMIVQQDRLAKHIQDRQPDAPNVNRIAQNVAALWVVWDAWWQFLRDSKVIRADVDLHARMEAFAGPGMQLALNQAVNAVDMKPTRAFLEALREGIDAGAYAMLQTTEAGASVLTPVAGWRDESGVYVLPSIYDEIRKRKFQAQQELGFSRQELYRLLKEEKLLVRSGADTATVVIKVGVPPGVAKRVLHLVPDVLDQE